MSMHKMFYFFFFNDTATTEIYTLSLHDALPISNALENYFLHEASVALLSGSAFGKYGEGYLRLSYANSIDNIDRALQRMQTAIENI